jgi:putative transposase
MNWDSQWQKSAMKYNPNLHHRRSIRLKGFDYTQAGEYFLTLCTHERGYLFGSIENEVVKLSDSGMIVKAEWLRTAQLRSDVELDEFIIMPNHMHAIIALCRGASRRAPTREGFGKPVAGSLPTIVRLFKSSSARRINELRRTPGAPVWQRNYYEHVIRDQKELERIRDYIRLNPTRWPADEENPTNISLVDSKSC